MVIEDASDMLLAITQAGRMLMFPVSDLPQLSRAKATRLSTFHRQKPRVARMVWRNCGSAAAKHADHSCWETQS
ncbi:hypothetical protein ACLB1R_21695 [Escherichia coli]